ncbi:MAG: tryptophanyl-tRNA synthetase [Myxococcota bacterium]|jgi:tryptophanyl-tRNA synthetase
MLVGKEILFSGMQPTGSMHIGNYLGAIESWVDLQDAYECIYCIVDYHALTGGADPEALPANILEMATWLLACGLDPKRSNLFVQSQVPEHTELCWIFNTVTPMGELGRMTQFKDKSSRAGTQGDFVNVGLFNYPVLQAADIMLYKAAHVPVGEDQRQHLELTREIARKFNARYGATFPEAHPLIKEDRRARVMGLDGKNKMSKSLDNHIPFAITPKKTRKRVMKALTDPQRGTLTDPGRPEKCNVFTFHGFFSTPEKIAEVDAGCRAASFGCGHCKGWLSESINERLGPIRDKAADLGERPDDVRDVLRDCGLAVRERARVTMDEVRAKVGLGGGV